MPKAAVRLLFLAGHGMLDDPEAPASVATTLALIRRLGFVQLDSISVVERAHHHIQWTRLHGYRPPMLERLHTSGRVFEGWTHDASFIPSEWYPHWRHRFDSERLLRPTSWVSQRLGSDAQRVLRDVLEKVRRDGPVLAREFEHNGPKRGAWWEWKPAKAALEYWWRTGVLSIAGRGGVGGFEKVYDLTERVLPHVYGLPPSERNHLVKWACRGAMERLGAATPRELANYWGLVTAAEASSWCHAGATAGRIVPVEVMAAAERPRRISFAVCD